MKDWESIRRDWTQNHESYSPNPTSKDPFPIESYENIYTCLLDGKSLKTPLNLSFIIKVLVHGWKSEGLFTPPPDYIKGDMTE